MSELIEHFNKIDLDRTKGVVVMNFDTSTVDGQTRTIRVRPQDSFMEAMDAFRDQFKRACGLTDKQIETITVNSVKFTEIKMPDDETQIQVTVKGEKFIEDMAHVWKIDAPPCALRLAGMKANLFKEANDYLNGRRAQLDAFAETPEKKDDEKFPWEDNKGGAEDSTKSEAPKTEDKKPTAKKAATPKRKPSAKKKTPAKKPTKKEAVTA